MAQAEGVNEDFKATDQMAWVGQMSSIRDKITEIVSSEVIC